MDLRIEEITISSGRVRCDVRFSFGSPEFFYFTVVRIRSGSLVGLGEGLGKITGRVEERARPLVGQDARRLDALLGPVAPEEGNTARECLSMALYDLVAKAAGVPLYVLLGPRARRTVPLMPAIFPKDAADAATKAKRFADQGFKALKFKMMGDFDEDMANLRAIRAALGPEGLIQGDANRGYRDRDALLGHLAAFDAAGLDIFEDPLDGSFEEYAALKGRSGVRIMIDVGARSVSDIRRLLEMRCCDIINQHPCQQGGMSRALAQSHAAELMGIPTGVGGTGFLGVGTAAYHHLASVIGLSLPCGELGGLCDHGFADDVVRENLPIADGAVTIPDTPGIGVEIDDEALARLVSDERRVTRSQPG